MRGGVLLVMLAILAAVGLVNASYINASSDDLVNMLLATLSLANVPDSLQARYELFHTAYVSEQQVVIVNKPLIPGENLIEFSKTGRLYQAGI